jgi:hypothetical protein
MAVGYGGLYKIDHLLPILVFTAWLRLLRCEHGGSWREGASIEACWSLNNTDQGHSGSVVRCRSVKQARLILQLLAQGIERLRQAAE